MRADLPCILELPAEGEMLLLSRRAGEAVMIGSGVKIVVLKVKGGQVRLGIEAPQNVLVDREEVYRQKKRRRAPGYESEAPLSQKNMTY